ncbi:hypothetical protein [Streptomyces sp. NPDC057910]|uniref:hypothetical protein n=1 Tax=Streptomyces sp. NPDC057910 TaxID=3346278 RepID=UPI0036EF8D17
MGFVLMGHGSLNVNPAVTPQRMEIVAIPPNTEIQFYADAGQGLAFAHSQLNVWEQLVPHGMPLNSRNVTYNLTLGSAWGDWEAVLEDDPQFGDHSLIRPGIGDIPDPVLLCTGTPDSCPTSPAQVAAGRTHRCKGIFGRSEFQGEKLFWLACTIIKNADQSVVAAALEGMPNTVLLGEDPTHIMTLDGSDFNEIDEANIDCVNQAEVGEIFELYCGGSVLLLGGCHKMKHVNFVAVQDDFFGGTLTVLDAGFKNNVPTWGDEFVREYLAALFPNRTYESSSSSDPSSSSKWSSSSESCDRYE